MVDSGLLIVNCYFFVTLSRVEMFCSFLFFKMLVQKPAVIIRCSDVYKMSR